MPRPTGGQRVAKPTGRQRLWRAVRRSMLVFGVATIVGLVAAAGLVLWGDSRIDRRLVDGLVPRPAAAEAAADEPVRTVNVLVVGSDSREGMTREQIAAFGTGRAEGNRTDSIMLVSLELNGTGRGAVLSFPRDLRVTRCDGSVGKINAANAVGEQLDGDGPTCLVRTVSRLTGVPVHHYIEVSFAGFLRVVDAIGGIDLYLERPISDEKAHIDLPAGCVHLEGPDALGFVRARHVDNDFGRIARQQRFLKETLRQAATVGVLANPARLVRVVDGAASSIDTDSELTLGGMRDIALGMRRLTADGLVVHTVPSEARRAADAWYVEELPEQAQPLYAAFRDGSVLDAPPPDDDAPTPALVVRNAGGRDGIGAAAARMLETRGYRITEVGNAPIDDLAMTRVTHPPHLASAAAEIASIFDGAVLVAGTPDQPLTVDVGTELTAADVAALVEDDVPSEGASDATGGTGASEASSESEPAEPTPEYVGARAADVDC